MLLATIRSLLRFNKSLSRSCRPSFIQTSLFIDDLHTTTTFNSSSKFGTFILQQANLHTTTTTTTSSSSSKFGTFILQTNEPSYGGDDIKMFMLSSRSGSGDGTGEDEDDDDQKKKKKMFKLDDLVFLPFYKDFQLEDSLRIVGSCNGIICLHDPDVMDSGQHYAHLRDVFLWNPATRQFRILPASIPIEERIFLSNGNLKDFGAFGFDVKTNDYKVLRITPLVTESKSYRGGDGGFMCRVQVYSLNSDSWRLLEGIDSLPVLPPTQQNHGIYLTGNHGIYLNGSYFFLGTKPINHHGIRDLMLLSFDFTKEIFTTMQLPEDCSINKLVLSDSLGKEFDVFRSPQFHNSTSVSSYLGGDKMAVFTTPRIDFDSGYWYYDIWVLNEQHGSSSGSVVVCKESESWTKLHSFQIKTKSKQPGSEPRCISNDGEFALISTLTRIGRKKLRLFNLVTKEAIKDFTMDCRATYVYKESLVSIMGGNVLLRWQLPTHGTTYKLNLDAPFIPYYFAFGIGLCLTSDTGGCIGVRSLNSSAVNAVEGEAMAMYEAIKWAKELELSPIIIESNSENCVSFFMEDDDDNNLTYWSSEAHSILKAAKLLLNSSEIGTISFEYCSRSCNYVADIAAKLGREGVMTWSCKDWTANFPGEIVMSLSKDLGLETPYTP